jgi:hypothetical protein
MVEAPGICRRPNRGLGGNPPTAVQYMADPMASKVAMALLSVLLNQIAKQTGRRDARQQKPAIADVGSLVDTLASDAPRSTPSSLSWRNEVGSRRSGDACRRSLTSRVW